MQNRRSCCGRSSNQTLFVYTTGIKHFGISMASNENSLESNILEYRKLLALYITLL